MSVRNAAYLGKGNKEKSMMMGCSGEAKMMKKKRKRGKEEELLEKRRKLGRGKDGKKEMKRERKSTRKGRIRWK